MLFLRSILLLHVVALLLTACGDFEQTLDLDPPAYEKQLVMHVLAAGNDTAFAVPLTRNFGLLEPVPDSAWQVKGALVGLYEDSQLKATLVPFTDNFGRIRYTTSLTPGFFQPGRTYEVRATHPDFPLAAARQVMPSPFGVDSAVYRLNGGISSAGEELSALDVYLKDAPGERNYYVMTVERVQESVNQVFDPTTGEWHYDTSRIYFAAFPYESEDPNVNFAVGDAIAVSDQFFDGQPYRFSFRVDRYLSERFRVRVRSVTEDYYRYLLSAQRRDGSEDFPLADPVVVHDNVEGGIGIFGLGWEEVWEVK